MFWEWYDKNYKKLIIIPTILLLTFSGILIHHKVTTGEFVEKGIEFKGGTVITISTDEQYDVQDLESKFSSELGTDVVVRKINDIFGHTKAYEVSVDNVLDYDEAIDLVERLLGDVDVSIANQEPSLGASFFRDAVKVLAVSFILISLVSFYYFRKFYSALTIVVSAISDIIAIFAVMDLFGMKFSIATIGALLMVLGYSTDSNILLTTNIVKRKEGTISYRIKQTLKTELTQDFAAYLVYFTMFFLSNVSIIKHIALILILGIFFDEIFTLVLNNTLQRVIVEHA
ncbi:hypothetical protein DRN75_03355 [Nanoarchaeota archaeon]|nr:MAG: hypothetical protein DRN75_03355 [Nanoarchaeota archaeon]